MVAELQPGDGQPAGAPRKLFALSGPPTTAQTFAVTPDGQRIIAIVAEASKAQRAATVIVNWTALEKRHQP